MTSHDIDYETTLSTLRKIQSLEITLTEAKIMHQEENDYLKKRLGELEEQIASLKETIPSSVLRRYERMRSQNHLGVSSLAEDKCANCRMAVPVGDINRMKLKKKAPCCQTCGVYLFVWD